MTEVAESGPAEPQARHVVYCGGEYLMARWQGLVRRLEADEMEFNSVHSSPRGMIKIPQWSRRYSWLFGTSLTGFGSTANLAELRRNVKIG